MNDLSRSCALALGVGLTLTHAAHAAEPIDPTTLSLEKLLEVNVIGASKYEQKQSEVAAAVSVVTREEIRTFGWRTLEEALASLPGLSMTYDRQYSYLGARGFGLPGDFNTRALLTIDGNRVNDPVFDAAVIERAFPLDLDLVERIEFIPGPGGAVYGQNAMFGVINVVTREGGSINGTELAVGLRQPQREKEARVSYGRKLDSGLSLLLSVSGQRARGEDRYQDFGSRNIAGVAAGLDGERDRELFAKISHGNWSFQHVQGQRRKDDPVASYLSDPLAAGQFQGDEIALTQLNYQTALAPTLQGTARIFTGSQHYTADAYYDGSRYASPARSQWYGTEFRLVSTALARHKLMAGIEGQRDAKRDQYFLDRAEPVNDGVVRGSGYRVGIYVQDEWQLRDDLITTLGVRVDRTGEGRNHTSPRFALIWRAAAATTLKALYGRAHREPNAYERDFNDAVSQIDNPSLRGETIDTLEFVVDQRVGSDLALRASIYQWRIRDLITLGIDPVSDLTQYQSGQDVEAQGLELSADKTWRNGARLRGSVAFQGVEQADGDRLINSPRLLAKLNLSAPLPWYGLRLGYQWNYGSSRLSGDGTELGGFALSHLYVSTGQIAPGLDAAVGIHNLFDKRYAHPGSDSNWQNALHQPGRAAMLRLVYRF